MSNFNVMLHSFKVLSYAVVYRNLYQTIVHFGVYSLDITGPMMVAVVKLITFACNWDDSIRLQHKEVNIIFRFCWQ